MAVFKEWRGSLYTIQLLIINLFGWFAWLSAVAFAQLELSEAVTGSVSFPDVAVSCLGNIAVLFTSMLRGRLDLENGARDVMATNRGPKLKEISCCGLATCGSGEYPDVFVVMLSNHKPHSSIKQFMKHISHSQGVESILLQWLPINSAAVTAEICECSERCRCIVVWTEEEITIMLARRIPGTLKQLSNSLCLLPCLYCLTNGCHGCNQGVLHVENGRLREGDSKLESPSAVCEILDDLSPETIEEERTCICIPVHRADYDVWTKLLIRSLRSKDKEDRGVRDLVSDALEIYISQSGGSLLGIIEEEYSTGSIVVPRFAQVLVNLILSGWFKVDGFSSSLVARRAIKDYIVDSTGTEFPVNAFVSRAWVKSDANNTNVCQVLRFRDSVVGVRSLAFTVGCVELICSITWGVRIAIEGGGADKLYSIHSMSPSITRVCVIVASIGIALCMDCLHLYLRSKNFLIKRDRRETVMVWAVIVLEIGCIVTGGAAVAGGFGIKKGIGRWVYSAVQGLVWVKWGIGSYLLGDRDYGLEHERLRLIPSDSSYFYRYLYYRSGLTKFSSGIMVYSSAFLLNSILAGVRGNWK